MRIIPFMGGCAMGWLVAVGPVLGQIYGDDTAYIEITQGSYRHLETLRIYADDRLELRLGFPTNATSISDGATGIYNRLAHYLASEGPKVVSGLAEGQTCPDWGEITIRAEPAVAGISHIRADCPDTAIEPLRDRLLQLVGR